MKQKCTIALFCVENSKSDESTNQNQDGAQVAYVSSNSCDKEHFYRSIDDDYEEINDFVEINLQNNSDYEEPVSKDSNSYAAITDVTHNLLTLHDSTGDLNSCSGVPDDYLEPVFAYQRIGEFKSSVMISDNYRSLLTDETNAEGLNSNLNVSAVCDQQINRCSKECAAISNKRLNTTASDKITTEKLSSCSEKHGIYLYPVHDEKSTVDTRTSENSFNLFNNKIIPKDVESPNELFSDYLNPIFNEQITICSNRCAEMFDENPAVITTEATTGHSISFPELSGVYLHPVYDEPCTGHLILSDSHLNSLNKETTEEC